MNRPSCAIEEVEPWPNTGKVEMICLLLLTSPILFYSSPICLVLRVKIDFVGERDNRIPFVKRLIITLDVYCRLYVQILQRFEGYFRLVCHTTTIMLEVCGLALLTSTSTTPWEMEEVQGTFGTMRKTKTYLLGRWCVWMSTTFLVSILFKTLYLFFMFGLCYELGDGCLEPYNKIQ